MKITLKFLGEKLACGEGIEWFKNQKETDSLKVLEKLIEEDRFQWANWLIFRVMTYKQYVSYAIFAAEQVIDIFEKKFPKDKRPRRAIEAAKTCLKDPSDKNKKAASAAYAAAYAAASAAAASAANAAAYATAAYATAYAASAANAAANAAAYAAASAAASSTAAANTAANTAATAAARKKMRLRILDYGLKLLTVCYSEGL